MYPTPYIYSGWQVVYPIIREKIIISCEPNSTSEPKSVVEQFVQYKIVENEKHGHAQNLIPVYGTKQNDYLECDRDALH